MSVSITLNGNVSRNQIFASFLALQSSGYAHGKKNRAFLVHTSLGKC